MLNKNLRTIFFLTLSIILVGCDDAPSDKEESTNTIELNNKKIEVSNDVFKSLITLVKQASSSENCQKSANAVFEKMSSAHQGNDFKLDKNKFEVSFVTSEQVNNMEQKSSYNILRHGSNCMVETSSTTN